MPSIENFGTFEGKDVSAVSIANTNGLRARLITFGARLTELHVPDHTGETADIVLGFDTQAEYAATDTYFGATCGRYGNRIREGRFALDDVAYQLDVNEGPNHLHGGSKGFDRKIWTIADLAANRVTFTSVSEDGEMGFPGKCDLKSTYELTPDNKLIIIMEADTTRPTLMNMVHHSYFNLGGQGSGTILGHLAKIDSSYYVPVDERLLATGEILSVKDTAFDFRDFKPIGRDFSMLPNVGAEIFGNGGGYDHNWCLDGQTKLHRCIEVYEPSSGRRMTLDTSEPGVQIYTSGYLSEKVIGKKGLKLCKFAGFTLETQKFPGSPNHAHFPTSRLDPGEHYRHEMVFSFTAEDPQ